jgi:hypothetical protein
MVSGTIFRHHRKMVSRTVSRRIGPVLAAVVAAAMLAYGPIPQLASYHDFADKRPWAGVANAGDVLSNAGFAIAGAWGLWISITRRAHASLARAWPAYALFSLSLFFTALGSGYYHLAPDNARLVWDRLPIAAASGALIAAVHADTHERSSRWMLPLALVAAGIASVLWWIFGEARGAGDLRPYLLLQAAAVILVPAWLATYPAARGDRIAFAAAIALYILAKLAEAADKPIYAALGFMSGHSIKHWLAVAAGFAIVGRLACRTR